MGEQNAYLRIDNSQVYLAFFFYLTTENFSNEWDWVMNTLSDDSINLKEVF